MPAPHVLSGALRGDTAPRLVTENGDFGGFKP